MTRLKKGSSTKKQMEYAKKRIFSTGQNKRDIALEVGYSKEVAATTKSKIESTDGFKNAVGKLALKSNNIALNILEEFERRGVKDFSNKDLISGLDAIGRAWERFTAPPRHHKDNGMDYDNGKNPLRTVILQTVNNQTIQTKEDPGEQIVRDAVAEEVKEDGDKGVEEVDQGNKDEEEF